MKTILSFIFGFITGVLAGVAGVFIYQVWGRPTIPTPPQPKPTLLTEAKYAERFSQAAIEPDLRDRLLAAALTALESQEKTQPVNAWQPEDQYGEMILR